MVIEKLQHAVQVIAFVAESMVADGGAILMGEGMRSSSKILTHTKERKAGKRKTNTCFIITLLKMFRMLINKFSHPDRSSLVVSSTAHDRCAAFAPASISTFAFLI